jgi:hypothetical protein
MKQISSIISQASASLIRAILSASLQWLQVIQRAHRSHSQAIIRMLREIHDALHLATREFGPRYLTSKSQDTDEIDWNIRLSEMDRVAKLDVEKVTLSSHQRRLNESDSVSSASKGSRKLVVRAGDVSGVSNKQQGQTVDHDHSDIENEAGELTSSDGEVASIALNVLYSFELDTLNGSDSEAENVQQSLKADPEIVKRFESQDFYRILIATFQILLTGFTLAQCVWLQTGSEIAGNNLT